MCVLERLLERGDRLAAFIGIEGGGERDFCPEILELCDGAQIPARSGHKLGEEIVRWLEDRVRPELAIVVGVQTEVPLAIGGNCRLGLVEILDMFQSESCPGVVLRQRGQDLLRRELPWPDDADDLGDAYIHMIDLVVDCVEEYLDGLRPAGRAGGACVPYVTPAEVAHTERLVERPDPGDETLALEREVRDYLGADAVFALRSAADGFRLLAEILGLDGDAQVVTPSVTSSDLLAGLGAGGAQLAAADVHVGRLTLDPDFARDAVCAATRALVIAHPLGQPAELDLLHGVAEEHGLEVIEDAGGSLGARFGESRLGRGPCCCVFRLPLDRFVRGACAALVTLPSAIAERFEPRAAGLRLGDGTASLARLALARLDLDIAARRVHAGVYSSELSRYDAFAVPPTPEDALPVYKGYLLHVTRYARTSADDLHKLLVEAGVETRRLHLAMPEHELAGLPVADHARASGILLPVDSGLSVEQRDHVLELIFDYAIG